MNLIGTTPVAVATWNGGGGATKQAIARRRAFIHADSGRVGGSEACSRSIEGSNAAYKRVCMMQLLHVLRTGTGSTQQPTTLDKSDHSYQFHAHSHRFTQVTPATFVTTRGSPSTALRARCASIIPMPTLLRPHSKLGMQRLSRGLFRASASASRVARARSVASFCTCTESEHDMETFWMLVTGATAR